MTALAQAMRWLTMGIAMGEVFGHAYCDGWETQVQYMTEPNRFALNFKMYRMTTEERETRDQLIYISGVGWGVGGFKVGL